MEPAHAIAANIDVLGAENENRITSSRVLFRCVHASGSKPYKTPSALLAVIVICLSSHKISGTEVVCFAQKLLVRLAADSMLKIAERGLLS
jgi:hypothetical protein